MIESLKQVLMRRDGLTNEEADELIDEVKDSLVGTEQQAHQRALLLASFLQAYHLAVISEQISLHSPIRRLNL